MNEPIQSSLCAARLPSGCKGLAKPTQDRRIRAEETERRQPKPLGKRLKARALAALALALIGIKANAAPVVGTLNTIGLTGLNTAMTWTPTNDPLFTDQGFIAGPAVTIYTTNPSAGSFSNVFAPGPYVVSFPLISWRRAFEVIVPPGTNLVQFTNTFLFPRYFVDAAALQAQINTLLQNGGSATNVFFGNGTNTVWRVSNGTNFFDVVGISGGSGTPPLAGTNVYITLVNGSNQFNVPLNSFNFLTSTIAGPAVAGAVPVALAAGKATNVVSGAAAAGTVLQADGAGNAAFSVFQSSNLVGSLPILDATSLNFLGYDLISESGSNTNGFSLVQLNFNGSYQGRRSMVASYIGTNATARAILTTNLGRFLLVLGCPTNGINGLYKWQSFGTNFPANVGVPAGVSSNGFGSFYPNWYNSFTNVNGLFQYYMGEGIANAYEESMICTNGAPYQTNLSSSWFVTFQPEPVIPSLYAAHNYGYQGNWVDDGAINQTLWFRCDDQGSQNFDGSTNMITVEIVTTNTSLAQLVDAGPSRGNLILQNVAFQNDPIYSRAFSGNGGSLTNLSKLNAAFNTGTFTVSNNNTLAQWIVGTNDGDLELVLQNKAVTTNASGSWYVVGDNGFYGLNGSNYFNGGYNGSIYRQPQLFFGSSNDAYLFVVGNASGAPSAYGGNVWIGTYNTNSSLNFSVGNKGSAANATLTSSGLSLATGSYSGSGSGLTGIGSNAVSGQINIGQIYGTNAVGSNFISGQINQGQLFPLSLYQPATNGGPVAYSQLPYTPPTNNYTGLTNASGVVFATNGGNIAYSQLPYTPSVTNGNGGNVTNLNASNLSSGTVASNLLPNIITQSITFTNPNGKGVIIETNNGDIRMSGTNFSSGFVAASGSVFSGNAGGLTNLYGTNLAYNAIYLLNANTIPNPGVIFDATVPYSVFTTNGNFIIGGFTNLVAGYQHVFSVTLSNANNSAIVVSNPAGAYMIGSATTNGLSIPAAKEAIFSFWVRPNSRTNVVNAVSQ